MSMIDRTVNMYILFLCLCSYANKQNELSHILLRVRAKLGIESHIKVDIGGYIFKFKYAYMCVELQSKIKE